MQYLIPEYLQQLAELHFDSNLYKSLKTKKYIVPKSQQSSRLKRDRSNLVLELASVHAPLS